MAIDTVTPAKTLSVMRFSMRCVRFGRAMLLTDRVKHSRLLSQTRIGVDYEHTNQEDRKVTPPGMPELRLPLDYELAVLRETPLHFKTSHVLFMEWDSAVLNPAAWDTCWLRYDYIGAPWPPHKDPGWPECDESNNVGNGGFSLKSHRLCEQVRKMANHPAVTDPSMWSSDRWICRTIRPQLERMGLRFAPESVAERFSCENRVYSGQFGFHGKGTATLNNWGKELAHIRV